MVRPKLSSPAMHRDPAELHYRAIELDGGRLMPIEVRLGRRLLRTIPAESEEGRMLLDAGKVKIVAYPDWERGGEH